MRTQHSHLRADPRSHDQPVTEETQATAPVVPLKAHPELRRALAGRYGAANYRIEADGAIYVRGPSKVWRRIGSIDGEQVRLPGRPILGESRARKITIYMDAESQVRAKNLGDGNISLGVRRALEIATL